MLIRATYEKQQAIVKLQEDERKILEEKEAIREQVKKADTLFKSKLIALNLLFIPSLVALLGLIRLLRKR